MKIEGPGDKTWAKNDQSVKLDGAKRGAKVDDLKVTKWTVRKCER